MASNSLLEQQITAALAVLKTARFDGDHTLIDGCENHLNSLIEELHQTVPVP